MVSLFRFLFVNKKAGALEVSQDRDFFCMNLFAFADFLAHAAYILYFLLFTDNHVILALQLGGTLTVLLAYILNRIGQIRPCAYILTIETGLFVVVHTLLSGMNLGFEYQAIIGIIPLYLFTNASKRERDALTIFVAFCVLLVIMLAKTNPPVIHHNYPELISIINYVGLTTFLVFERIINTHANSILEIDTHRELEELNDKVMKDPLTTLWNRRYLDDIMPSIYEDLVHKPACVAVLDLDNFKKINDSYGHPVGDEVLKHFAQCLKEHMGDDYAAIRHGGEEFLILLRGVNINEANMILNNFKTELANNPLKTKEHTISFTFTCGISQLQPCSNVDEAIKEADIKMYLGKKYGRNKIII